MSLINALLAHLSDQAVIYIALGGLVGSFICFLTATGYQLSANSNQSKGRIYCLKRALILSGVGNLLLTITAVVTALAVNGTLATMPTICAAGLSVFGVWLLHRGLTLKAQ